MIGQGKNEPQSSTCVGPGGRFFRRKQRAFFKGAPLRCAPALRAARKGPVLFGAPGLAAPSREERGTKHHALRSIISPRPKKRTGLVNRSFGSLDFLK